MRRIYSLLCAVFCVATLMAQAPANDSCHNARILTPGVNPTFDTAQLTGATSDMTGCGTSEDIWFKFEVPATGAIRI